MANSCLLTLRGSVCRGQSLTVQLATVILWFKQQPDHKVNTQKNLIMQQMLLLLGWGVLERDSNTQDSHSQCRGTSRLAIPKLHIAGILPLVSSTGPRDTRNQLKEGSGKVTGKPQCCRAVCSRHSPGLGPALAAHHLSEVRVVICNLRVGKTGL